MSGVVDIIGLSRYPRERVAGMIVLSARPWTDLVQFNRDFFSITLTGQIRCQQIGCLDPSKLCFHGRNQKTSDNDTENKNGGAPEQPFHREYPHIA
ncbi:MAG: hypothetical protein ABR953_10325 [Candidatus Acidiferrales bacterium]|jgi:hypothetical protein